MLPLPFVTGILVQNACIPELLRHISAQWPDRDLGPVDEADDLHGAPVDMIRQPREVVSRPEAWATVGARNLMVRIDVLSRRLAEGSADCSPKHFFIEEVS